MLTLLMHYDCLAIRIAYKATETFGSHKMMQSDLMPKTGLQILVTAGKIHAEMSEKERNDGKYFSEVRISYDINNKLFKMTKLVQYKISKKDLALMKKR